MIVDSGSVGARLVARRLREVVAVAAGGPTGPPTLSIGVATLPDHADSAETLLAASDAALYNAKANGRDGVALPDPAGTPTS